MKIAEYQVQARALAIYPNLGNNPAYPALGLGGEMGEMVAAYKWLADAGKGVDLPASRKNLEKEIGDVLWYVANLAAEMGIVLEGDFVSLQHNRVQSLTVEEDLLWAVAHVGRAQEVVKKVIRDKDGSYDDEDRTKVASVLDSVLKFLCHVCFQMGFVLDCVAQGNLDKLNDRKKRDVLQGDGDDR